MQYTIMSLSILSSRFFYSGLVPSFSSLSISVPMLYSQERPSTAFVAIRINCNSHLFYLLCSLLFTAPSLAFVLLVPLFSETKMDVESFANGTVQQMAVQFMLYWIDCLVFL